MFSVAFSLPLAGILSLNLFPPVPPRPIHTGSSASPFSFLAISFRVVIFLHSLLLLLHGALFCINILHFHLSSFLVFAFPPSPAAFCPFLDSDFRSSKCFYVEYFSELNSSSPLSLLSTLVSPRSHLSPHATRFLTRNVPSLSP